MDEKEYKYTYQSINPQRCVFEKAINSRVCNCNKSQRFNLADREGVACTHSMSLQRCNEFLKQLRDKARFALKRLEVEQPLAHKEEIKIQNGGLIGLQAQLKTETESTVENIDVLITLAEYEFNNLANFPYSEIMQVITTYKIRDRRKRRTKHEK